MTDYENFKLVSDAVEGVNRTLRELLNTQKEVVLVLKEILKKC